MIIGLLLAIIRGSGGPGGPRDTSTEKTDRELLEAAIRGKPEDVRRFMITFTPLVHSGARHVLFGPRGLHGRLVTQEDVVDAGQEAFEIMFREDFSVLKKYEQDQGTVRSYLYSVTKRQTSNFLGKIRAGKRGTGHVTSLDQLNEGGYDPQDPGNNPEVSFLKKEKIRQLKEELLPRLSDKGRRFFRLIYIEELETEEIMLLEGVSRDVVYTWTARIRALARDILEGE